MPYVAGWANGDIDLLKQTASRVLDVARGVVHDAGLSPGSPRDAPVRGGPSATALSIETPDARTGPMSFG